MIKNLKPNEDLRIKIVSKEQAYWESFIKKFENEQSALESAMKLNGAIIVMIREKIKLEEEKSKNGK